MTTVEKRRDNLYQVQTDTRSSFGSVRFFSCLVVDYFVHCICYFLGSEKATKLNIGECASVATGQEERPDV